MKRSPLTVLVLVMAVWAVPASARPVISEVAWAGDPTSDDYRDEWIEIFNPDAGAICDLSQFVLVGAGSGAVVALPAVGLASNDFFIIQDKPNVPPVDATHAFDASLTLTDGGEALCLCPVGTTACDATCDIANPAVAAWFAGSSTPGSRKTMERLDPTNDGALDASWADGAPASPLTAPFGGTPGSLDACAPVDAGPPPSDAGQPDAGEPEPDAGPNDDPSIVVTEPNGSTTGATVQVTYSASDDDPGDAVTVELFWSADTSGADGVRFARGLPGGAGMSATLDTAALPVGTWHVFGRARDTRGAMAFSYAPGTVEVGEGGPVEPQFEIVEPDGVDDSQADGTFGVQWRVELPAGAAGTVSLFVDDDDEGADGEPLMGGLAAGPEGPRAFLWDPLLTGTAPGVAHLYGVLDWSGGRVVAYAPAPVTVVGEACACQHAATPGAPRLLAGLTLAILLLPFHRAGVKRRRG